MQAGARRYIGRMWCARRAKGCAAPRRSEAQGQARQEERCVPELLRAGPKTGQGELWCRTATSIEGLTQNECRLHSLTADAPDTKAKHEVSDSEASEYDSSIEDTPESDVEDAEDYKKGA